MSPPFTFPNQPTDFLRNPKVSPDRVYGFGWLGLLPVLELDKPFVLDLSAFPAGAYGVQLFNARHRRQGKLILIRWRAIFLIKKDLKGGFCLCPAWGIQVCSLCFFKAEYRTDFSTRAPVPGCVFVLHRRHRSNNSRREMHRIRVGNTPIHQRNGC